MLQEEVDPPHHGHQPFQGRSATVTSHSDICFFCAVPAIASSRFVPLGRTAPGNGLGDTGTLITALTDITSAFCWELAVGGLVTGPENTMIRRADTASALMMLKRHTEQTSKNLPGCDRAMVHSGTATQ